MDAMVHDESRTFAWRRAAIVGGGRALRLHFTPGAKDPRSVASMRR